MKMNSRPWCGLVLLACLVLTGNAGSQKPDSSSVNMGYWVNCLDTLGLSGFVKMEPIAALGEPLVAEITRRIESDTTVMNSGRFCSNAVEVLRLTELESAIRPLFDLYFHTQNRDVIGDLYSVLGKRKDLWQPNNAKEVDLDRQNIFQAMLSWAVLGDSLPGWSDRYGFSQQGRCRLDTVFIYTTEMNKDYRFSLRGREFKLVDDNQLADWADQYGDCPYLFFEDVGIYQPSPIESIQKDKKYLRERYGLEGFGLIGIMLYYVTPRNSHRVYMSGGGDYLVWIKLNGKWNCLGGTISVQY